MIKTFNEVSFGSAHTVNLFGGASVVGKGTAVFSVYCAPYLPNELFWLKVNFATFSIVFGNYTLGRMQPAGTYCTYVLAAF